MLPDVPPPPTVEHLLLAQDGHSHPSSSYCVDYLAHTWNLDELAESWKAVTRQKCSLLNGYRLENASWRVWAKTRNNLPTVRPESLNWLKDSDVTWLYGPLYTWVPTASSSLSPTALHLPTSPSGLKPALKRRGPADWFRADTGPTSPRPYLNSPSLYRSPASCNASLLDIADTGSFADSTETLVRSPSDTSLASEGGALKPRLRFKSTVEQCMALLPPPEGLDGWSDPENDDEDDTDNYHTSEGKPPVYALRPRGMSGATSELAQSSLVPLLVDPSVPRRKRRRSHCTTIVRLEPTVLKSDPGRVESNRRPWLVGSGYSSRSPFDRREPPIRRASAPTLPVMAHSATLVSWLGEYMPQWWSGRGPWSDITSLAAPFESPEPVKVPVPLLDLIPEDYSFAEHAEDIICNIRDIASWCSSIVAGYNLV